MCQDGGKFSEIARTSLVVASVTITIDPWSLNPRRGGKTMTQQEYERLKTQAANEYHANLEAIERVYRMTQPLMPSRQGVIRFDPPQDEDEDAPATGAVIDAVREFAASMGAHGFTIIDIARDQPGLRKGSVRNALSRLEESGFLEVIERGAGRTPHRYRQKEQAANHKG